MTEEQYWYNRSSQDVLYSDREHQYKIESLSTEAEFAIFKAVGAKLYKDGDKWCCLYGENIQEGICGFGDTPHKAVIEFNSAFYKN